MPVKDTTATFTPGPWTVTIGADALVKCPDGRSFTVGDAIYHADNIANAHLIAAAPAMFYALRAIRRSCPTDPDVTREFNAAWGLLEAAIAKAEGTA